eukprot:TRINITY_DN17450_c0_g1_i1.p1 TRINITY_DN17450_c0_g1~~TRINITY_DN17450_c0_g1_i1.p1  ORF type:complete len:564 (-),score=107.69 TRINITY_DN17450_c0_g1_i1:185-1876(-)
MPTTSESVEIKAIQHVEMGCCHLETENYETALSFFQKALEVDPNNKLAKDKILFCQQKLNLIVLPPPSPTLSPDSSPVISNITDSPQKKTSDTSHHITEVERVRWAKTYYDVMGIDPNDSNNEQEIKKKYRNLARILHPDKNLTAGSEAAFKLLHDSYNVLSDSEKKTEYDQQLKSFFRPSLTDPYSEVWFQTSDSNKSSITPPLNVRLVWLLRKTIPVLLQPETWPWTFVFSYDPTPEIISYLYYQIPFLIRLFLWGYFTLVFLIPTLYLLESTIGGFYSTILAISSGIFLLPLIAIKIPWWKLLFILIIILGTTLIFTYYLLTSFLMPYIFLFFVSVFFALFRLSNHRFSFYGIWLSIISIGVYSRGWTWIIPCVLSFLFSYVIRFLFGLLLVILEIGLKNDNEYWVHGDGISVMCRRDLIFVAKKHSNGRVGKIKLNEDMMKALKEKNPKSRFLFDVSEDQTIDLFPMLLEAYERRLRDKGEGEDEEEDYEVRVDEFRDENNEYQNDVGADYSSSSRSYEDGSNSKQSQGQGYNRAQTKNKFPESSRKHKGPSRSSQKRA